MVHTYTTDGLISAALAEIEAHVENGTWELAQLPPGKRTIGSRWVFKLKRKPDGSIDKYKGTGDTLQRGICIHGPDGRDANGHCIGGGGGSGA